MSSVSKFQDVGPRPVKVIIRLRDKERVQPAEIHQRLAAQPCENLCSKSSVEWWYAQFVCGREEIEGDYRFTRRRIERLKPRIFACLEPF
jgi:hypothetical protein